MKKGCLIAIGVFFLLGVIGSLLPNDKKESSSKEKKDPIVEAKDTAGGEKSKSKDSKVEEKTKWKYSENEDEMTEKKSFFASLRSDNEVDFEFPYDGGSYLSITVRNSPKYGKDVYFSIDKGQFNEGISGCNILVKFDNGNIEKYQCVGADDASTGILFLASKKDTFINKLKSAKEIKIQASFFQEGDRTFTFTTPVGLVWNH